MATLAATAPRTRQTASPGIWMPAYTLWVREIVRFYRQKARVVGVIASPLIFWVVLGAGFAHSFNAGRGSSSHYLAYFFPGSVAMIVLFTAIFSMMSLIQDRNEGFLLSVLAAPVSRSSVVLGKVLGGATLAAAQGIIFLVFAPLVGVHLTLESVGLSIVAVLMISFELTALGFAIAWPMDSTQAFHAVVNVLLIPLWLLSGALFPLSGAAGWMRFCMMLNPLTYGVEALRGALFPDAATAFSLPVNMAVTLAVCLLTFAAAWAIVNRRTHRPAA
ncbi:MAG TPA: ABC transporter permease [Acidobacteriaceae bacterium]|nr:ABC transporter permease [Acidobacteriaceae bacterium]